MPSFPTFLRTAHFPVVAALAACILVSGCATRTRAPVEDRSAVRGAPVPRMQPAAPIVNGPVSEALPPTYTVKRGDTLHQIALDTGLDYRELAAWNNIENVNRIYVGQVLRLMPPGALGANASAVNPGNAEPAGATSDTSSGVVTAPLRAPPPIGEPAATAVAPPPSSPPVASATPSPSGKILSSPKAVKEPYSEQAVRDMNLAASAIPAPPSPSAAAPTAAPTKGDSTPPATTATRNASPGAASGNAPPSTATANPPASAADAKGGSASSSAAAGGDHLDWMWPAKGKIVTNFSETANLKGIDIAGTAGEPVRASAPGRVVYAGNGLRGYGKLIIIKHNDTYLSAYAHNREILVKEGQQVTRGQKIAEMGNTDADQVKLHFEIRRHGKPMDPTKYLPAM
jgi:lipoprotein NlpD